MSRGIRQVMKCKFIRFQDVRCKGPRTNTVIQEQAQGRGGGLAAQRKKPGRWARDWSRSICLVALMPRPRPATGQCSREAPPPRSGLRSEAGLRLGVLRWETGQDEPAWGRPGPSMAPPHPRSKLWTNSMTTERFLNLPTQMLHP